MYSLIFRKTRNSKYPDARKIRERQAEEILTVERTELILPTDFAIFNMTSDDEVLNEEQESRLHHKYAVVVQDLASKMIQSYPCKAKSAQEMMRSLVLSVHPEEKPKSMFTDNSLEFITLAKS